MAAKTTLNAKNLETLGAPRLAELLIEISTGSAANKRRLRMELAGNHSGAEIAREVRKRFASIARSRTVINWRKVKAVTADLETQRKTIVDVVAPDDPKEALELAWQLLALADPIFQRSANESSSIIESFHQTCVDAGVIATSAGVEKDALADKICAAVQNNDYGQYDPLIAAMAPALGKDGLERLQALFMQWSKEPEDKVVQSGCQVLGWSSQGAIHEVQVYGNHRERTVRIALQEIADAQGDVDAYIAQQPEKTRKAPLVATDIARRLLSAGRAAEALETLDAIDTRSRVDAPIEWQLARVEVLEALGGADEAQADRWKWFEQSLNDVHLRAFIRRLPDFDDMEAEEKAFAFAQAFPEVHRALAFFLHWPALAEAAKLVLKRKGELNGDLYDLMTPAAEALAEKHPLAATIVLRSMIDFTLENARSSRYKHAARHLVRCASLTSHIEDFAGFASHDAYVTALTSRHGNKRGFRSLMP
ncbi:DUF6880 family protein [Neorhizobium sp. T7_12]|uniref:DUF6880 family protein n=1 Tax=Neorhizobium sp. T7_12 TaxID=2093832 RepID=UPI000CF89EE2|nr:DUF6880 family protein [Neorhizobium sp. T7_12]